jgi:Methyltransferase domain
MSFPTAAQLRRRAGRAAHRLAGIAGFELVRRPADPQPPIPPGRLEPFVLGEYEVVPRGGFDVVRRDYYSPVPDLSQLTEEVWTRRSRLGGLALDTEAAMAFVEDTLASAIAELDAPAQDPGVPGRFFLANHGFETVDAELLYAMVRTMRPRTVVELGSGYSTLLINLAAQRNDADGSPTAHEVYDPHPRPYIIGEELPAPSRLTPISATDVTLDVFAGLTANDILFVDTTHTVKLASDVNYLILDVLPVLAPGVIVHFHDIFLPWEYPREWFEEMRWYWAEQYLLQAFLAFNPAFEILVPAHAVARSHPERLRAVVPSFHAGAGPGSMWLRTRSTIGAEHGGGHPPAANTTHRT